MIRGVEKILKIRKNNSETGLAVLSIFDCEIPSNVSRAFYSDEIKGVIGVVLLISTRIATALPSSLNVFQFPRTCYFFFFFT